MGAFKGLPIALQHLTAKDWWVLWRLIPIPGKPGEFTKPPYQARAPQRKAKSNDPTTWAPFNVALSAYNAGKADGVGLCLLQSELGVLTSTTAATPTPERSSRRRSAWLSEPTLMSR